MDSLIELPPAANPLTAQNLLKTLGEASSLHNYQELRIGTQQLQEWETERSFYKMLQEIFIDKTHPTDIRYLAIIQLKNGIDKYWRKNSPNAISPHEKASIRSQLLAGGINEAFKQLALQSAIITGKIVRFDYPNEWPEALPEIISLLNAHSQGFERLKLSRTLLLLLHVIKELSTARLKRHQDSLQKTSPDVLHSVGRIYVDAVRRWQGFLKNGGDDEGGALDDLEISLLCLRLLRRLLVSGYEFPNRNEDVSSLWLLLNNNFGDMLLYVSDNPPRLDALPLSFIEKHILQISKLHLAMARSHPAAFGLLPDSSNLVKAYWNFVVKFSETFRSSVSQIAQFNEVEEKEEDLNERISLHGLLILRTCTQITFYPKRTFKYRRSEDKMEEQESINTVRNILSDGFVLQVMEIIITKFFVLRDVDLRDWTQDGEEWERKEDMDGDGWEFSIRACAEKLFLDIMINFQTLLVQPVLQAFYQVAAPVNSDLLQKDSVYTAVAISSAVLYHHLDFDNFLNTVLIDEIKRQGPGYNMIRRSIAILLGQWVPVRVAKENRPLVYQIFQHFLDTSDPLNDDVVRITAARQFKNVVNDIDFETEAFVPFAATILDRLMALIGETESTETRMVILNTVSIIVERMGHQVRYAEPLWLLLLTIRKICPHADRIVDILPSMWEQSDDVPLMKQAILTLFVRLVTSMELDSLRYHDLALALVRYALDPESAARVYMLEDALDLWASILVQTEKPSAPLLSLIPDLLPLLEIGTEVLPKVFDIVESYMLLSPLDLLSETCREPLLTSMKKLLASVRSRNQGMITQLAGIMIRCAASIGEQTVKDLVQSFVDSGFLHVIIDAILDAEAASRTTGPRKTYPGIDSVVESDYLGVLCRLVLVNPRLLFTAIEMISADYPSMTKVLLKEWFRHFDHIGDPSVRKLNCLALTQMLELRDPGILQDLMVIWTDVVTELREGLDEENGDSLIYHLVDVEPNAEAGRRSRLLYSDPVHCWNVAETIRNALKATIASIGEHNFYQLWLVNIDADVRKSFNNLDIL